MILASLIASLGWPLALLLALWPARTRRLAQALVPLAPLPALWAAAALPEAAVLELPWVLLGTRLGLDATGRLFLLFTALTWLAAGLYASAYLGHDARRTAFWAFFLATQAGNLGLCLALDLASFYTAYALLTFAAYGLVVHTGTAEAWRAGRIYLVMAVLGELTLIAGLMMTAHAAGSPLVADLRAASPSPLAVGLVTAGLGVKVGLPLLHLWLPLAHPVAPVPASAVLSGVMLKAGLLGWLRFLPLGHAAYPEIGTTLMVMGIIAMFYGVAVGLAQRDIKVVLAYSSVSQMGFMTLGVGAGLTAPGLWPALLPAVGLYALHHALAKSALFLGAGVALQAGGRPWVLAGLALPALALAGAPLTSGWLAKAALKGGLAALPAPWTGLVGLALPLAALGTTLLMTRLLWLVRRQAGKVPAPGLALPWLTWTGVGLALPWGLAPALGPSPDGAGLAAATWPVLLGLVLAIIALRGGIQGPAIPPGDLVVPLERLLQVLIQFRGGVRIGGWGHGR
ncbi:MAG: complex I subunit 5 family protein [Thiobacillaceae bacterium]